MFRCSRAGLARAADINQSLSQHGWTGAPVTTDVEIIKIAYGTEREPEGGTGPRRSVTTAVVLVPRSTRTSGAQPIVIAAHGTVGVGAACAPSTSSLAQPAPNFTDTSALYLGLAGQGWIVIAPDYGGYGFADAPPGYFRNGDEVRSVLDAPAAMRMTFPAGALSNQSVIVGHSQGGHVALSAQPYAETYGLDGELAGVAVYAPFWIAMRAWGAVIHPVSGLTPANAGTFYMYTLAYYYTNGEASDGAAGRLTPFLAAKQATVETFMQTRCHNEASDEIDTMLGATADEIFDPAWMAPVTQCAFDLGSCAGDPASALWASRWAEGRPALSPTGAPVVIWGGRNDTAITPRRLQCGLDKIAADLGAEFDNLVTLCGDDNATHSTIMVQEGAVWVSSWIEAVAAGGPAPAACPGAEALSPAALDCDMTFPNVD